MDIDSQVFERLLVAKGLVAPIRFAPSGYPDRITLAQHVLTSHDAAELAVAAITQHLKITGLPAKSTLMEYIAAIEKTRPSVPVPGRGFFDQLNRVRADLKHASVFPEPRQWFRVGELTYGYLSSCCGEYLGVTLDALDESSLLRLPAVVAHYQKAREHVSEGRYRECLEELAHGLHALFEGTHALRTVRVGDPNPVDAIKLAAYGVHANDYLALQEFLPSIVTSQGNSQIAWQQSSSGHPGNWTVSNCDFCLHVFVAVGLRVQDAAWIPGPIPFFLLYEYSIQPKQGPVQVFKERSYPHHEYLPIGIINPGEIIRSRVLIEKPSGFERIYDPGPRMIEFISENRTLVGMVIADQVDVKCVPRSDDWVKEHFPSLPEIEYLPSDS